MIPYYIKLRHTYTFHKHITFLHSLYRLKWFRRIQWFWGVGSMPIFLQLHTTWCFSSTQSQFHSIFE